MPFGDGFAGVFRCDNKRVQMNIFAGFSKDGVNWEINHEPIKFKAGNTDMIESDYKYDPRVTWIEDRYWITWCNGYHRTHHRHCLHLISRNFSSARTRFCRSAATEC